MPPRKGKAKPQKSHNITLVHPNPLVGGAWYNDVWDGVKSGANWTYNNVLKPGAKFVKDQKLISKALRLSKDPRAQAAAVVADQAGFGMPKQRGAGKHIGSSNL